MGNCHLSVFVDCLQGALPAPLWLPASHHPRGGREVPRVRGTWPRLRPHPVLPRRPRVPDRVSAHEPRPAQGVPGIVMAIHTFGEYLDFHPTCTRWWPTGCLRVRGSSTSCPRPVSSPWRNPSAPSEVASSCPRLPDSRKEAPLFFSRKCFFTLSVINVRPPHPAGPPPLHPWGPAPTPDVGHSRSRIVIEPASVPEAAAKPALRHAGLYGARLVAWIPFYVTRHGLVRPPTGLFPAFAGVAKTRRTRLRAAARKTAAGTRFSS